MRKHKMLLVTAATAALTLLAGPALAGSTTLGNSAADPGDEAERDSSFVDWTVVDGNNPAEVDGTINAIDYFSLADNEMAFFLVDENFEVTWVGDKFDPGVESGTYELEEPAGVSTGDMIGMYFGEDTGSIAFVNTGESVFSQGNNSGFPEVEETLAVTSTVDRTYSVEADITPAPPETKDACKNGGWEDFSYYEFRNQGQCVSFLMSNENAGKR